jgi:DNA-directed RNA polymerase
VNTFVYPKDTRVLELLAQATANNDLHLELTKAADKAQKREDRAMSNAGFGQTIGGMAITTRYHERMTEAVKAKLSGPRAPANSITFKFERMMRQLDPAVIALCILQSALHCVARDDASSQREVNAKIARHLNDELFAAKLLQTDKSLSNRINKKTKETYGNAAKRKATVKKLAEDAGFTMREWNKTMVQHAGSWGLNILLREMPEVFEIQGQQGYNAERRLVITKGGLRMAQDAVVEIVRKSPVYQPRTAPPKPWTRFEQRLAEDASTLQRVKILRTTYAKAIGAATSAINSGRMAPALDALNILQGTPWKINTWIMEVIEQCHARGVAAPGLPSRMTFAVPERLSAEDYAALPVEDRQLRSKQRTGLQKASKTNNNNTILYTQDMESAKRLAEVDRFYIPVNMDWRGRVYSLPFFNFAREDRVRAMFQFADGAPIGERGLYWLKVHVANSGAFNKVDKRTIEERVKWCDDNMEAIENYVVDPINNTGWTKADAPFVFLAGCKELVQAIACGTAYVTHMPVSFDGACNGLQHLCAMTRSTEGRLVNLTDNAAPLDVYQVVADIAKAAIVRDLDDPTMFGKPDDDQPERKTFAPTSKLAAMALAHGVGRSLVKRNVMTFAYSSNEFGMTQQHIEDTMEPLEYEVLKKEREVHPFGETRDEWKLMSRYLAKRTLAAIKQVVSLPAGAMGCLQGVARALAHEGACVSWVSPAGIPCINRYHESTTKQIQIWCYDKGVNVKTKLTVATGYTDIVKKEKAASAIAPNVVHSMDAAHLLLTVQACGAEGITSIATIHDSFGCLPSQADRFNQIIREQFLRMYAEHDILAEILETAKKHLVNHKRLPELPAKGTLDLTEILNAQYAFA